MPLPLEQAKVLVEHAHAHAREAGLRVTVAIVDEAGLLQMLARMDGSPRLSAQIAEAKAAGAAVWEKEGGELADLQEQRGGFFDAVSRMSRLPLMPARGAVLISDGSTILGAVGVSGASSEQDEECAMSGLRALSKIEPSG